MSDGPKRLEVAQFRSRDERRTDAVLQMLADAIAVANERGSIGVHVVLENPDQSFTRLSDPDCLAFMVGALHMSCARLSEAALADASPVDTPDDDPDDEA